MRWLNPGTVLLPILCAASLLMGAIAPPLRGRTTLPPLASARPLAGPRPALPPLGKRGEGVVARSAPLAATPAPLAPPEAPPTPNIPLELGDARFSLFTVNPRYMAQRVEFTLSRSAHLRVRISPQGYSHAARVMDLGTRPAGTLLVSWDGRDDAGARVPEGLYTYRITAVDQRGVVVTASYNGLGVTYKRLVVSLSHQSLTAYDGDSAFLTTLVTTGNAALPTPVGVFPILGRYHPFTFISPWPRGSAFYYPPSPANYALLFDNRGYYVHDAPWRNVFGPGTNTTVGTPGRDYTGTHGCVNVPPAAAQQLYSWATIGTVVQVVP